MRGRGYKQGRRAPLRLQHALDLHGILESIAALRSKLDCVGRHAPLDSQIPEELGFRLHGWCPWNVAGRHENSLDLASTIDPGGVQHPVRRVGEVRSHPRW